jgi:hypothetical protein
MGKYGSVASIAAELMSARVESEPRAAWTLAAEIVFRGRRASIEKGCPRDTFLALCGAGAVQGVEPGDYTRSVLNRSYALRSLDLAREDPSLFEDEEQLWRLACGHSTKVHNHQMDVVRTLWRRGWLNDSRCAPDGKYSR